MSRQFQASAKAESKPAATLTQSRLLQNSRGDRDLSQESKSVAAPQILHEALNIPIHSTDRPVIQPKLMIGAVGDKYEQEADRIAAQVVNQINAPQSSQQGESIQRQKNDEDDKLQMKPALQNPSSGIPATPELEAEIGRSRTGGQPLAESIRRPMEQAFGADFSDVRVHEDSQSDQLNRSIQSLAFTIGKNIFFRRAAYTPSNQKGQSLISHELTHVLQQQDLTSSSIQRLTDLDGDDVDIEKLNLEQIEAYLERKDTSYGDVLILTQRKAVLEASSGSKTRNTRRQEHQKKAQNLKKKSDEELKKKRALKPKITPEESAEKRKKFKDEAAKRALEANVRFKRSDAKRAEATALKSEDIDMDTLGHYFTGEEVPSGQGFSGIGQDIKNFVKADLEESKEPDDIPPYVKSTALDLGKSRKEIDFLQDERKRTILIWGKILPSNVSFDKDTPDAQKRGEYDDRGHLVPEGGMRNPSDANKVENIVAENKIINQKYKKAWEDTVKEYARDNPKSNVWSIHEPLYQGDNTRPYRIRHYVVLNTTIVSVFTFDNPLQITAHQP